MHFKPRIHTHELRPERRRFLQGLVALAAIGSAAQTRAADPFLIDAQSTDEFKRDAFNRIPLQAMTPEAQTKIKGVVQGATYFRRMPQRSIECDQELFKQFVRYPEILVGIWDAMGATKVQVDRTAPFVFQADDGAGTKCNVELLYGNDSVHVYYSTGDYTGKLVPKKIDGRSVCVVHSAPKKQQTESNR